MLDLPSGEVFATWTIAGGGSPDMGNLSADGKWLWLSGRYDGVIYAFNTDDGSVKTIPVGGMPHGLTVWPQPGRYSLGHPGICGSLGPILHTGTRRRCSRPNGPTSSQPSSGRSRR